jgi:hypothetical protein
MSFSSKFFGMIILLSISVYLSSCNEQKSSGTAVTNATTGDSNIPSSRSPTEPKPLKDSSKKKQFNLLNPAIPSNQCKEIDNNNEKKDSLARRLVGYMELQKYEIYKEEGEINIVYIEGACADGNPNKDEPNIYNDRRIIFKFVNGEPKIVGNWLATTEPGDYYIKHLYSPEKKGAALIAFTQHKNAWEIGMHRGTDKIPAYESLVEVGNIKIIRDLNRDGWRNINKGDSEQIDNFDISQHKGSNKNNKVNKDSAGCLVGKTPNGHEEFMSVIKQDPRFVKDKNFKFTTTVIDGDEFAKGFSID